MQQSIGLIALVLSKLVSLNGITHGATSAPRVGNPFRNNQGKPPSFGNPTPTVENVGSEMLDGVSPPKGIYDKCGVFPLAHATDLRDLYKGNKTLEEFKENHFIVFVREMNGDQVVSFDYTNGTFSGTWSSKPEETGRNNARRSLASYMALLGDSKNWLCNGVLINSQWVMTAAHCFSAITLNVVRLGEYDFSDDTSSSTEFPLDFSILKYIIYPEYKSPFIPNDLALVKLNRPIPQLRHDLRPACLPWGRESLKNLVGQSVILTVWTSLSDGEPLHPILQEGNLTVFDPNVCHKSYSKFSSINSRFSDGINGEVSICAANQQGGIDACQGSSGAPIAFLDSLGRYTIAGIATFGQGCRVKDFPGVYTPLNNQKHLSWIKETAFS